MNGASFSAGDFLYLADQLAIDELARIKSQDVRNEHSEDGRDTAYRGRPSGVPA